MTKTDLLALADKIEAADASEQRELLEAAFVATHGPKPPRIPGGSQEWVDWLGIYNPFHNMLAAEAYESAALMLVPEHVSHWNVGGRHHDFGAQVVFGVHEYFGDAVTPALTIAAAALRARAEECE